MSKYAYQVTWYNEDTEKEEPIMVDLDLPQTQSKQGGGCSRKVALTLLVIVLMALAFEAGCYYSLLRLCSHC